MSETIIKWQVDTSDLPLVHTIWDASEIETYPTNLKLIHSALTPLTTNKKLGWMITVLDNPLIGFLAQAGTSNLKFGTIQLKHWMQTLIICKNVTHVYQRSNN